jgi:hypothetical protein
VRVGCSLSRRPRRGGGGKGGCGGEKAEARGDKTRTGGKRDGAVYGPNNPPPAVLLLFLFPTPQLSLAHIYIFSFPIKNTVCFCQDFGLSYRQIKINYYDHIVFLNEELI